MTSGATVIPFPLARRQRMIDRQARYAAELNGVAAERHIKQQLKIQSVAMRRRGIDVKLIRRELKSLETAIRAALFRSRQFGGAG